MANIAYVRVSTVEQNEARQVEALQKYEIDKWYTEKVSGKNLDRPQLQAMLDYAREGDTIFIHDFSRISRNTSDLLRLMEKLQEKGIHVHSNKEGFDTTTPNGRLMLGVIALINEFERANLLERQREGIAIAKRAGKYKGRNAKHLGETAEQAAERYRQWCDREKTKAQLANEIGCSRPTLDRMLKEQKEKQAVE